MTGIELGGIAKQSSRAQVLPRLDAKVRQRTRESVAYHADHPEEVDARFRALDREWGVERWLQLNSALLSLVGLGLGALRGPRWLLLPAVVQGFLAQHAVQGFCPPLLLLRWLGVRTASEVERERAALKVLRGELRRRPATEPSEALRRGSTGEGGQPRRGRGESGARSSTASRVPARTNEAVNARIRREAEQRVALAARHPGKIAERLRELDREWDVERVIQLGGSQPR